MALLVLPSIYHLSLVEMAGLLYSQGHMRGKSDEDMLSLPTQKEVRGLDNTLASLQENINPALLKKYVRRGS